MRRTLLLAAATAAAASLAACQRTDAEPNADPGVTSDTINAAQDATSSAVGAVSAATIGPLTTESFVTNAVISNAYEIEAGRIAQTKGQSEGVRQFGKMMVDDHTALSNTLTPLIRSAGETPPSGLDERRRGLIDNLNAASPQDFDSVYLDQQAAAHQEALTLMQGYAERGENAGLKAAAAEAAPKIRAHQERVQSLQGASRPAT